MDAAQTDPTIVATWLERATDAARRSGNPTTIAFAAFVRGRDLGNQGRLDEARPRFVELRTTARTLGDLRQELIARSDLAHATRHAGLLAEAEALQRAAVLFGAAEGLGEISETVMMPWERAEYDAAVERVRTGLAPTTLDEAWTEGRALSMGDAVAVALSG